MSQPSLSPVSRSGRFASGPGADVARFTESISFDWRLWWHVIHGSLAHAAMLQRIGVLTRAELKAIQRGLKDIAREIEAGKFKWKAELEDVHMTLEAELTKRVPAGVKLDQPIAIIDLFPSIAAALNLPLNAELKIDGVNQWPAIAGGKTLPRPPFLVASADIALFDGDWKLIETNAGQRTLYNLKADISEAKDLLSAQTELAAKLGAQLDILKKDLPAYSGGNIGPGGGKGGKGKGKK